MSVVAIRKSVQPMTAFAVASAVHVLLAFGIVYMPRLEITPPQAVGGFEVVDLSAFGGAHPTAQDVPEEAPKVEQTEAEPEPEPEPIVKADPAPLPVPVAKPKPVAKPEPKPKPVVHKAVAKPAPKPTPKPVEKAEPSTNPVSKPMASSGSQNAFVPPSSEAAYLRNPKPAYPSLAKRRGMQGVVLLYVEVSPDGHPLAVTVKKGSGYSILDKAALKAVWAWRFAPAMRGSTPVRAGVEIPIRFILNDA